MVLGGRRGLFVGLWLGVMGLLALGIPPNEAWAAPTATEKAQAKQAWVSGRQLMAAGKHAEAEARYRAALELENKVQHKLDLARALIAQAKLVESFELLNQIVTTSEPNTRQAQAAAKKEIQSLEPRLPWIRISVTGPENGAQTLKNGQPIEASEEVPIDPGKYTISAEAQGFRTAEKEIVVDEGEHEAVTLKLEMLSTDAAPTPDEVEDEEDGGDSAVPAIIAFSVGGIGIGVGAVFGIMAFTETNDVEERCGGQVCPPAEEEALQDAKSKGTISTIGFIVGGVGIATGVVLLLTMGSDDEESAHTITPQIGFGYIGVSGGF